MAGPGGGLHPASGSTKGAAGKAVRFSDPQLFDRARMRCSLVILVSGICLLAGGSAADPGDLGRVLGRMSDQVRRMRNHSQALLQVYLSEQDAPLNGSHLGAPGLRLRGLPPAAIAYRAWRALTPGLRLQGSYRAYSVLWEYLLLARDDQSELGPGPRLPSLLGQALSDVRVLLGLLGEALEASSLPVPSPADPLDALDSGGSPFRRRLRGYLVCREYRQWLARTDRDLAFLGEGSGPDT